MCATAVLEGLLSVQAAVEAGSRPISVIYLADDAPAARVRRLQRVAGRSSCALARLPRRELDALASGRRHGGVVALAGPRRFASLDSLLGGANPFLAMLDGVEDPYNFGQAVRALYAAGADGLVVGRRDWTGATAVVARASAGASERIAVCAVDDVAELVGRLHCRRIRIVCAEPHAARSVYDADLTGPLLLLIGGERRGIRRSLAGAADERVGVPYGRAFDACLDVTSATAALAFEVARQRRPGCGRRATVQG